MSFQKFFILRDLPALFMNKTFCLQLRIIELVLLRDKLDNLFLTLYNKKADTKYDKPHGKE